MKILYLRANNIDYDSRVNKEVTSLLKENQVTLIFWDRKSDNRCSRYISDFPTGQVLVYGLGFKATWGGGIWRNLLPFTRFNLSLARLLIRLRKEYDVIHAVDLVTFLPSLCFKFFHKKRIIYDIFDFYAHTKKGNSILIKFLAKLEKFLIRYAETTIICSEERMNQIMPSKPKKLIVIHNAPSMEQELGIEHINLQSSKLNKTRVCYVGNLISERYVLELIEAISQLPDFEFHVGGVGVLGEKVERLSSVYNNIFYYGPMSYSKVLSLEVQCHLMVALYDNKIKNNQYASPNKYYEALMLGKPIIALKNTGFDRFIVDYNLGVVVQEVTKANLEFGLLSIKDKLKNGQFNIQNFKSRFRDEYCWELMEGRLLAIYKELDSENVK